MCCPSAGLLRPSVHGPPRGTLVLPRLRAHPPTPTPTPTLLFPSLRALYFPPPLLPPTAHRRRCCLLTGANPISPQVNPITGVHRIVFGRSKPKPKPSSAAAAAVSSGAAKGAVGASGDASAAATDGAAGDAEAEAKAEAEAEAAAPPRLSELKIKWKGKSYRRCTWCGAEPRGDCEEKNGAERGLLGRCRGRVRGSPAERSARRHPP